MKKLFWLIPCILIVVAGATFILWQEQKMTIYRATITTLHRERDYARFQVFFRDYWGIRTYAITHDESSQVFYFISNMSGSGSSVYRYDYENDTPFQNGKDVNIDLLTSIYNEKMEKDNELRLLGLMDGELIFYKTVTDDSPGPCFSPWIGGYELFSVGVYSNNNIKYPYVVSPEKKKQEEERMRQCQIDLNASYNSQQSLLKEGDLMLPERKNDISTASLAALRTRVEDWDSYSTISEKEKKDLPFATGCPTDEERAKLLLRDYPIKKLNLFTSPSRYDIETYQTPNPYHWTTEQFERLNGCGELGLIWAQRAFPEHLLWSFPYCSAGYAPDTNDSDYNDFQRCQEVEKILVTYLSQE